MSTEIITQTSPQKRASKYASRPNRVTGALKQACDLMVWGDADGSPMAWDAAARAANLTTQTMRRALERRHVRQYLKQQRDVFCAQASASNISHAVRMRAESPNQMARMQAVRFIEDVAYGSPVVAGGPAPQLPGITVIITNQPAPRLDAPGPLLELTAEDVDYEPRGG